MPSRNLQTIFVNNKYRFLCDYKFYRPQHYNISLEKKTSGILISLIITIESLKDFDVKCLSWYLSEARRIFKRLFDQ